ncbi:DNA-binding protein [Paractinoplanes atraurantiacus]|uniref:Helix-turn-helix domain-containing protein n=1 Tax=Paractinoplanes atraurantiacus TaxID=1036182 RepID=A0A285H3S7_9ACTN|nr:DNA-binding protein [Actinoplanes atraurantiacus]SNY29151.1 hypothetical protein SAMN05421748_103200 [Actinoplanes atraurantiacus]
MAVRGKKLYTIGDIAEMLGGVTRQYADRIVNDRRRGFPEPFDELRSGKVWLIEDVDAWFARQPKIAEDPEGEA